MLTVSTGYPWSRSTEVRPRGSWKRGLRLRGSTDRRRVRSHSENPCALSGPTPRGAVPLLSRNSRRRVLGVSTPEGVRTDPTTTGKAGQGQISVSGEQFLGVLEERGMGTRDLRRDPGRTRGRFRRRGVSSPPTTGVGPSKPLPTL